MSCDLSVWKLAAADDSSKKSPSGLTKWVRFKIGSTGFQLQRWSIIEIAVQRRNSIVVCITPRHMWRSGRGEHGITRLSNPTVSLSSELVRSEKPCKKRLFPTYFRFLCSRTTQTCLSSLQLVHGLPQSVTSQRTFRSLQQLQAFNALFLVGWLNPRKAGLDDDTSVLAVWAAISV